MAKGGKRDGAGRKRGVPNKASAAREAMLSAAGLTPLEYFLNILRDESQADDKRFMAAKEAAPYVHPKLASTAMQHDTTDAFVEMLRTVSSGARAH
jgi:hypothetical protein